MNTSRKAAIIVGVLFLTAMVTSLLGGGIIESVLSAPDYLIKLAADPNQVSSGMVLEFVNAIAVVGIAVMLFPILKRHNESIALGYVAFRIIEALFCLVSAAIPLSLITLSQAYIEAGATDVAYFQTLGALFIAARADLAGLLIPVFFCLGALLFYYLLYQSKLLPRFISVWGLVAVPLVLVLNLFEFGMAASMILALPIILNEIFLGIWLIVKGFNPLEQTAKLHQYGENVIIAG